MNPLVSVICLCYNQNKFAREALLSVVRQTYSEIEILVVDDHSTDGSDGVIEEFLKGYPSIKFIRNESNIGNCRSFNKAFALSKGSLVVDFACDDVMLPERVEEQVRVFEKLDASFGVVYTNAEDIDEQGTVKRVHYRSGHLPPSGNVYAKVVESYFISPPTMMIRREVLEKLGGYDESLTYEDYDFWVRSARIYNYYYLNKVLTRRRMVSSSHSSKFNLRKSNPLVPSTYRVILKAAWLNKSEEENEALVKRIKYEFRHASYLANKEYAEKFFSLLKTLNKADLFSRCILFLFRTGFLGPFFYKLLRILK